MSNFGYALGFASEELRDDKDVVSLAIKTNPYAVKYASEYMKMLIA